MSSWANIAAKKSSKAPCAKPSNSQNTAASTNAASTVATSVAGTPAGDATNQSQFTEEETRTLSGNQAAIDAMNRAALAGGQQSLAALAFTSSASTSGPGPAMIPAWSHPPLSHRPAVPAPVAQASGPAAPPVTHVAPGPGPVMIAGGCPRCGITGGHAIAGGHAPDALLCDRNPNQHAVATLWPAIAAPAKQAQEDAWLQSLFSEYCWSDTPIVQAPAVQIVPIATTLTGADIDLRDSRLTFAPKFPHRLNEKNTLLAGGLQPAQPAENYHKIRTGFNAIDPRNPTVLTNHVRIANVPDEFWKYEIQWGNLNPTRKKKKVLIETMIKRMGFLRQNRGLFTHDNNGTIFASQDLYLLANSINHHQDHVDIAPSGTAPWTARTFIPSARSGPNSGNGVVDIGLQGERGPANVNLRPFRQMVLGNCLQTDQDVSNITKALNTIVADSADVVTAPNFETFQIGSNKFFLQSGFTDLRGTNVLQLHDGFAVTVKPAMGSTLLNFNSTSSAFYKPLTVKTYLDDVASPIKDKNQQGLKGLRVYINYERGQLAPGGPATLDLLPINQLDGRIKTIFQVGGGATPTISARKFTPTNTPGLNREVSVVQYLNHCQ